MVVTILVLRNIFFSWFKGPLRKNDPARERMVPKKYVMAKRVKFPVMIENSRPMETMLTKKPREESQSE